MHMYLTVLDGDASKPHTHFSIFKAAAVNVHPHTMQLKKARVPKHQGVFLADLGLPGDTGSVVQNPGVCLDTVHGVDGFVSCLHFVLTATCLVKA